MTRKRKPLSPEDRELWGRVVQTTRPLASGKRPPWTMDSELDWTSTDIPATQEHAAGIPGGREPDGAATDDRLKRLKGTSFRPDPPMRQPRHDVMRPLSDALAQAPVKMDKRKFRQMARGKLTPDARIDLHGMTLAQAHGALNGFILRAHGAGLRLVLVITGKGKNVADDGPIPRRPGALKNDVPQWLRMAPLASVVLEVREAHASHGGSGAYYVYLRRGS